jgi:hypothetical protein
MERGKGEWDTQTVLDRCAMAVLRSEGSLSELPLLMLSW